MKLNEFSLLDGQNEMEQLLADIGRFNDTARDYPRDRTIHSVFHERAAKTPAAVAAMHEEGRLTYHELDCRSNQLARLLVEHGVQRESLVAVMLDRSLDMVIAILSVLKAGGAYLPINTDLPLSRVRYMIDDARACALISGKRSIRALNKLQWQCPSLDLVHCIDSHGIYAEVEGVGEMMKEETWDFIRREAFDDISGGGWKSSFTGEWLSREVMDEYGENIRKKLSLYLAPKTRVLEIGVASGISMFRLAPHVAYYCGTDLSSEIISWTEQERQRRNAENIKLFHLPAHATDRLEESDFDVVVLNSVVQCFSGHNYLRDVLRKAIDRMRDQGIIFLGNLWDQDLQNEFEASLVAFEKQNLDKQHRTKTDRSEELFISRNFLEDLRHEFPEIVGIEFSNMLGKEESELSIYGYDAILRIDRGERKPCPQLKHRHQSDRSTLARYSQAALSERSGPTALAYVIYTSGTTSRPKGVMVEHRSILRLVLNTNYVNLGHHDRILQTGSLAFDASTFEIWGALLNGGAVCFPDEQDIVDPSELGRLIERYGITTMFLTTSLFNLLVGQNVGIFRPLKTLLTGGEKVSVHHFNRIRDAIPSLKLLHMYGPTENTTFSTSFPAVTTYETDVPIGGPIANSTVFILDDALQVLPIGTPGELCTGGDGLARGYLNDPELTSSKFVANPLNPRERIYRTGDLARWLPDGNVEFIGRKDDQVKVRGYRIEPSEIQNYIVAHEGVYEAFVIAKELGANGNELVAYVVTDDGKDLERLREFLKRDLPEYMIPANFIRLDSLPLTANGKVDRRALPDPNNYVADATLHHAPETDTEKQLVGIWEEVLGRKGVGRTDNFFDVGGHSLRVTKLVSLIEQRLGVVVPLKEVFAAATLAEMAQYVLDMARFGVKEIDEAMICMNDANDGPCVFAFPPGTGDAAGFIQLANRIAPYRFYGFNFIRSETRLSDYAELVTNVDPTGPYMFLGYSSGGNLAYHVAHEMENRGKCVSDIVMIDAARKLAPVTFEEQEIRRIAEQFLNHESNQPYLTSAILREKAYQLVRCSYHAFGASVDHHQIGANIHVLLGDDLQDIYRDASGRIVSSVSAWSEATDGTFASYQGAGKHNDLLYEPHLSTNVVLILEILNRACAKTLTRAI